MSDPRHKHIIPQDEIPVSSATISRLKSGKHRHSKGFPKPHSIGARQYYDAEELMAWFRSLPEEQLGTIKRRAA